MPGGRDVLFDVKLGSLDASDLWNDKFISDLHPYSHVLRIAEPASDENPFSDDEVGFDVGHSIPATEYSRVSFHRTAPRDRL